GTGDYPEAPEPQPGAGADVEQPGLDAPRRTAGTPGRGTGAAFYRQGPGPGKGQPRVCDRAGGGLLPTRPTGPGAVASAAGGRAHRAHGPGDVQVDLGHRRPAPRRGDQRPHGPGRQWLLPGAVPPAAEQRGSGQGVLPAGAADLEGPASGRLLPG